MASIPVQVADITLDWLNEVLAGKAGRIASFTEERFGEGVGILGELARLRLTYAAGESGPTTLIAKCQSPAPENIFLAQLMGFYLREVSFYREVADQVSVRVPKAYHVDSGADGVPFVLLLEAIEDAYCPNQIEGISVEEAERIIDTVAKLHAPFWGSPKLDTMAWLPPMNNPLYKMGKDMALAKWPGFVEKFGPKLKPETMVGIEKSINVYPEMLDYVTSQGTPTLTHTDCRSENYLFGGSAGDDVVTMIDFQLSTRHFGAWDLANLLGGSLTPEVRRANEEALIKRYVDAVASHGVTGYSVEQCTHEVHLAYLQMCSAIVITSELEGGNDRGRELLEQLYLRPLIAAQDHNAIALLSEFT
jgi:hypothetical protein